MIFDKAGAVTMMYTNAKYDRSDDVLALLGINKKTNKKTKMNVLKKLALAILLMVPAFTFAQTKIGIVNTQKVLELMRM